MASIAAGSSVWVRGPKEEVFSPAVVQSYERGKGYTVRMSLESGERLVRQEAVSLANDVASAADSCALVHINEATILHNLRARYEDQSIYSYVSSILIAVNPFQSLPIYGAPLMEEYAGRPLGAAEPHVYALAEEAYRSFVRTKGSQSLVVSGESGSGKTETNKHLMAYLAWRSKSESVGGDLAERILAANPLLEAFGNAKTSRNNNSSRFGKFVKVGLSERGSVLGATTKQYLLEKSRVPYQAPGERNYHIFYAAVAAAAHPDLACLGLDAGPSGFHYLNQSGTLEAPGWDDGAAFEVVRAALASVGAEPQTVREVFRVIAGLLHLGNVRFEGDEAASVEPATSASLDKAAELLGLPRLGSLLLARTLVTRGETTRVELTPERAALARDALAKATYARLFERTIGWINRATRAEGGEAAPPAFIGLLDVYGFEAFETNAFEQLSINFANEKLQQFFLKFVFKAEEELYAAEGVRRPDVEYQDNSQCIALIEQSPSGLLRLLDETCKRPNATDKSFCEAAAATHASNDFFVEPRLAGRRDLRSDEGFCVRHFAGDVVYTGRGFVEKNNDTLHADFTEQLAASGVGLVKDLFDVGAGSGRKGQSFNSVSRRFINDLNELVADLNATTAHFIRCVKPNTRLAASEFVPSLVLPQLRCSGTVDAVSLMAHGFPTRIPFKAIHERYAEQMPSFLRDLEPPLFCEALALALDIPAEAFRIGRTRLFFRAGAGQVLEELAERDISEMLPQLLEKVQQWERRRKASARLQGYARMWLCRLRLKKMRAAARQIQHFRASHIIYVEHRKRQLLFLARREREVAETRRRQAEERRLREEKERQRQEEAAAAAAAVAASAKGAAERADAEAAKAAAEAAAEAAAAAASAAAAAEAAAEAQANAEAPTAEQIAAQVAGEMQAAANEVVAQHQLSALASQDDTQFTVELTPGDHGLGLEVDHYRKAATIGAVWADGVAGQDGRILVGDIILGVNGQHIASYDKVIEAIRASESTVELTLRRKPIALLLESRMEMQAGEEWEEALFRLYSNREMTLERLEPPADVSAVQVRLAHEVRLVDTPDGGGRLEIETAGRTHALRSSDVKLLHGWRRELHELLPYLQVTEIKSGWLHKKGETASAGFKRRFCVLFSSQRLLYFDSDTCTRRKGAVDVSVAETVTIAPTPKGHGFEIATPGRHWVFAAESPEEQRAWTSALEVMLEDVGVRKTRLAAESGAELLKQGWADLKDESSLHDSDAVWEARWFALASDGRLRVFPHADAAESEMTLSVDLRALSSAERSKGVDYYDHCLDLVLADPSAVHKGAAAAAEEGETAKAPARAVVRMRPIDRGDMMAWMGVLQAQMRSHAPRRESGAVLTVLHQGYLEKKGAVASLASDWKRRFFVLCSKQEQRGDAVRVQFVLRYFKSEEQAVDLASGGLIDLDGANEVRGGEKREITVVTESRTWQLRAESASSQEAWLGHLRPAVGCADSGGSQQIAPPAAPDVTTLAEAELQLQDSSSGGQKAWVTALFVLRSDGILQWSAGSQPGRIGEGFADVGRSIGVWLLGSPGLRRLDIVLPERRWTLAADDALLARWTDLLASVAPERPVSELRSGWMEKKGAAGGSWKQRFFVLLSTHELLYYDSDTAAKPKGVIDLRDATACRAAANADYNYEHAFEVLSPKRTWLLCPDDAQTMRQWMADLHPHLGASDGEAPQTRGYATRRRSASMVGGRARTHEVDAESGRTEPASAWATVGLPRDGVLKSGWLAKRGEVNTAWKNRYFVLFAADSERQLPKVLRYYKSKSAFDAMQNAGHVPIDGSVEVSMGSALDADRPHSFEVTVPKKRSYVLAAPSATEAGEWVTALGGGVEGSPRSVLSVASSRISDAPAKLGETEAELEEVFSGWMRKRGQGSSLLGGKLKHRFFVLYSNKELHYFDSATPSDASRRGQIRVDAAVEMERSKPRDKKDFSFVMRVPGRDWVLDPGSGTAWAEWDAALRPMLSPAAAAIAAAAASG